MSITPLGFRALPDSTNLPAAGASLVGPVDPSENVSVSLRLRRRTDKGATPIEPFTATPRGDRKVLPREAYALQCGAASADLDRIANFAHGHGLQVVETSAARRTVVLSGSAEKMQAAFGVELAHYQTASHVYRGHAGAVHVPDDIADIVEAALGLDNRPLLKPHFRVGIAPPATRGLAQPQAVGPLKPAQVARLYNFPAVSAAGQTIGIIEFGGGFKMTDIQAWFNSVGQPVPSIAVVGVDGAGNSPGAAADLEVILDIDVAGAAAPGANIVVYFAPNTLQGTLDVITTAIHDTTHRPSVLSISWGGNESGWGASMDTISRALAEAAAVGVTVLVSSGDSGSENPAQVEYFASDPWVTACGGTTTNVSGSTFTQTVWGGSGGGISNHFARPYWQGWAGVPASVNPVGHVGRGVPDIAGNADPASGYMLIQNGAQVGPIGGTSAVAPLYAGLVALLNASLGEPVGYMNYNLYAFSGPAVYRDVTAGNNGKYAAVPGWDACTGFGTVDGGGIVNALWGVGLPPALNAFGTTLSMGWKGLERDDRIFTSTFNGSTWTSQVLVPNVATSTGVALATFNGKQFMAWKGMNADQGIYFSSSSGGAWAAQQMVAGVGTSTGPRLAVFGGKLYMAWKGLEGDQRLFWSSFNGSVWSAQQVIPNVASSVGPALAVFNNVLVAAWKGMYGDSGIYYSTFNGTTWAPQKMMAGVGSSEGPSLAVFNGALVAAWKGQQNDQRLWMSSFNGSTWTPQQQIPGVFSSVGPGLAVLGSKLVAAWKGMLGDERIWFSQFNGATWTPQQIVPGVGTSPDV